MLFPNKECNLYAFDTDTDKDKYHSLTMILHSHTECYINMHLSQRYIIIFAPFAGQHK